MNSELNELKQAENKRIEPRSLQWIPAVVLIVVGVGLLISKFSGFEFVNWWAVFLVTPLAFMAAAVWNDYRENGRLSSTSSGALVGGLFLITILVTTFFNLSWGTLWPLVFVFGGIAVLLSSRS